MKGFTGRAIHLRGRPIRHASCHAAEAATQILLSPEVPSYRIPEDRLNSRLQLTWLARSKMRRFSTKTTSPACIAKGVGLDYPVPSRTRATVPGRAARESQHLASAVELSSYQDQMDRHPTDLH